MDTEYILLTNRPREISRQIEKNIFGISCEKSSHRFVVFLRAGVCCGFTGEINLGENLLEERAMLQKQKQKMIPAWRDVVPEGTFHGEDVVPPGTFHGEDVVPPGTFHGEDVVPPGTFHAG
ncbi:hypothetical protein PM8797T_16755 [Gimesia maris DSM 8797]|uniref:Uncharacterized protein n=2 Tax=Gimesia maris TaxID=122 RepID=A0ABX5YIY5_9PLAN|nr:hypothetical protein PM8797T_16755 [Gimesia maris DSM 8797]QEG15585.1 hypothetical protein GmarT_14260 [Gimesia maris]